MFREHEKNGFKVPLRDEIDPEGSLEIDAEIRGMVSIGYPHFITFATFKKFDDDTYYLC